MILHGNRLLADDSHEISCLIFFRKFAKMWQNLSSAAVMVGALRVKICRLHPARSSCDKKKQQCRYTSVFQGISHNEQTLPFFWAFTCIKLTNPLSTYQICDRVLSEQDFLNMEFTFRKC